MSLVRFGGIAAALVALAGCVTLSKGLEDSDLAMFKGKSINQFLIVRVDLFDGSARSITNDLQGGLHKMVADLRRFCAQEGGQSAITERVAPYPKSYQASVPSQVRCVSPSADRTWTVNIDYRQVSAEQTRFGPILRYAVTYRSETPESIASDRLANSIAQERARDAAKAEDARRDEWNRKFRGSLKVGDRVDVALSGGFSGVTRGQALIIEIREPLAYLQFSNVEPRMQWVEISRLEDPNYRLGRRTP